MIESFCIIHAMEANGAVPLEEIERQESRSNRWKFCGGDVPRSELVVFSQVIIIYIVVCLCLFNLTSGRGDSNLWSALLSGSLGYLLPNPTIKR
jgi:hypothetical protein